MHVAYRSSKVASYSKIMSEILYTALVSPVHKITSFVEFNSIVIARSSFKPYGWTWCLKKSKSKGIANLLSYVFLLTFSLVVNVSAVPSNFLAPNRAFNPLSSCMP